MKKGCFINFVIIITILIGAALYIIQNKLDEFFIDEGRDVVADLLGEEIEKNFFDLKIETNKDSLKKLVRFFAENFDNVENSANKNADVIIKKVKKITSDSLISNDELHDFENLIMSIVNERPEKN